MTPEEFAQKISAFQHRISGLTHGNSVPSEETLEDLSSTLEELQVADEELRQQTEELVAAHLELDVERRRYQELFQLAPDAYLVTSLSGIVSEANQSAAVLFGVDPQFLTGRALAAYIATEDRPRFRGLLSELGQGGYPRHTTLFRVRARGGRRLVAELTYSVAAGFDGKPVGIRWLIRDVTEQERLTREIRTLNSELESRVTERTADLRAAQQLSDNLFHREQAARRAAEASEAESRHVQKLESIGVLAGGIAHDFNNLLHVVLGNADIALSRIPASSPALQPLEEVIRATMRAADLTRQMLAYSGKGAFVVQHLNLSNEVREMATLLGTAITKQASLVWELASELPPVNADATQIRQIVMNLITNASEAVGDAGGTIALRTGVIRRCELQDLSFANPVDPGEPSQDGEQVLVYLEVSDSGAGMAPDTLQRIFDPFFSTKFAGRGLGLAAVMGIVRRHQGLLRIRTEPGQGTTFRVLFPAVAGDLPASEPRASARSDWRGSGTVLVVDDEEGVREVAQRMLEEIGFDAVCVRDGREALELMQRIGDQVTAVLLDLSMPRMGGQETLRHLRAQRPELPIIMMSGYTEQAVVPSVRSGPGSTTFLQKPFLAQDLVEVLRPIVEVPI